MHLINRLIISLMITGIWCLPASAATVFEGIVKPLHEVALALPLDGVVAKILVKEGARVKKGDGLIQLDDTLQKLEVSRKEAINNDRAELEANKKNVLIVEGLLATSRELYRKSAAVSRDEVNNLEMQYHSLAGKIEMAEARKKQEGIEFQIARELLSRYLLVSPVNGYVTAIKRDVGEWVKTGEIIVTAADTSVCYAEFNIEERYARNLRADKQLPLKVREGDALVQRTGRVIYVAPVADMASALVRVKVEFDNRNGKTVPGVLAQISL